MNLILEKSKYVEYYTYLDSLFKDIPEFLDYNWLVSDIEYNYCTDSRLQEDPAIIDGASLNEILQKEKIQLIWGVFSGFKHKIESIPDDLPYADGNPDFWKGRPEPQIQGAEIEIVCWDSSCTLFLNANREQAVTLKKLYPDIADLDKANKSRG